MNLDQTVMAIIAFAGDSQSCSQQAIVSARESNWKEAEENLSIAKENALKAHRIHTELLADSAANELQVNFLMVHASNHLSLAEMLITTTELFIEIRRKEERNA